MEFKPYNDEVIPISQDMLAPLTGEMGGGFADTRPHGKHLSGDIIAAAGTPVVAPGNMEFITGGVSDGTAKNLPRPGDEWSYWRDTDTGVQYRFAHHRGISRYKPGDRVEKGSQWGEVGNVIKGTHLHMAVYDPVSGKNVDWMKPLGLKLGSRFAQGVPLGAGDFEVRAGKIAGPGSNLTPYDGEVIPLEASQPGTGKMTPYTGEVLPLESAPPSDATSDTLAQFVNGPTPDLTNVPGFGGPRSVMIPESRYQDVAKSAGVDVHPGWSKPLENIGTQLWGGAKQGAAGMVDLFEKLTPPPGKEMAAINKNLLTPEQNKAQEKFQKDRKEFQDNIKELLSVPPEMVGTDLASKILQGLGSAPAGIAKFGGAMAVGGIPGVAILGAVDVPEGATIPDRIKGALTNVALAGALKGTAGMATAPRVAAMGAIGGGQAALQGEGAKDITASAVVMAALGLTPGGRRIKEAIDADMKPSEIGAKEWEDVKEAIKRVPPERMASQPPQPVATPPITDVKAEAKVSPEVPGEAVIPAPEVIKSPGREGQPKVYQDADGWWRVEGTDVKTGSEKVARQAASRVKTTAVEPSPVEPKPKPPDPETIIGRRLMLGQREAIEAYLKTGSMSDAVSAYINEYRMEGRMYGGDKRAENNVQRLIAEYKGKAEKTPAPTITPPSKVQQAAAGEVEFKGFRTEGLKGDFFQRGHGTYIALDEPFQADQGTVKKVSVSINPRKIWDPNGLIEGTDAKQSKTDQESLINRLNDEAYQRRLGRQAGMKMPESLKQSAKDRTRILKDMGYEAEAGWIDGPEGGNRELVIFDKTKVRTPVEATAGEVIERGDWIKDPERGVLRVTGEEGNQWKADDWGGATWWVSKDDAVLVKKEPFKPSQMKSSISTKEWLAHLMKGKPLPKSEDEVAPESQAGRGVGDKEAAYAEKYGGPSHAPIEDVQIFEQLNRGADEFNKPRVSKARKAELIQEAKAGRIELRRRGYSPDFIKGVQMGEIGIPIPREVAPEPQAPAEAAGAKEPWMMTKAEYRPVGIAEGQKVATQQPMNFYEREADRNHKNLVNQAVKAGRPVPESVLADYPDLAATPDSRQAVKGGGEEIPKPEKGTYTIIETSGNTVQKKGVVVGDFGISKDVPGYYTIDHIRTNSKVTLAYPDDPGKGVKVGYFTRQKDAIEAAQRLQTSGIDLDEGWNWTEEQRKENFEKVKKIFAGEKLISKAPATEQAYSPNVLQGMKDWLENKAYIDGQGNYHLQETKKIAPWNKEVKRVFPYAEGISEAAQEQFPETKDYKKEREAGKFGWVVKGKPFDTPTPTPKAGENGEEATNQRTYDLLRKKIAEAKARRPWNKIPQSFEKQAVQKLFNELKVHFKDVVGARIGASKATTFDKLLQTVDQAQEEFAKRLAKSTSAPTKAGEGKIEKRYSFPGVDTEDLAKLATPGLEWAKSTREGIQSLVLPTAKSEGHLRAAEVVGEGIGRKNQDTDIQVRSLKGYRRALDKMGVHNPDTPLEENVGIKLMSDLSVGRDIDPKYQGYAYKRNWLYNRLLKALEKAGAELETVRDNYFPGMWTLASRRAFNLAMEEAIEAGRGRVASEGGADTTIMDLNEWSSPDKAWVKARTKALLSDRKGTDKSYLEYLTRRPLKGKEGFRKAKTFDDIMTGIEFGLEPISNNPVDLDLLKMESMGQSLLANRAFREFEAKGDLVNTDNSGRPLAGRTKGGPLPKPLDRSEWQRLPDRHGEIWRRDPDTHELIKVGERWAKTPVAEILDNYLRSGLYNNKYFGPIYRAWMAMGNLLNQAQLGMGSMFHVGFTAGVAQIKTGGDIIKDVYGLLIARNRSLADLGRTVKKYPLAMARPIWEGHRILKDRVNPLIDVPRNVPVGELPSTQEHRVAQINEAIVMAGGGLQIEKGLRTTQSDKMYRDWYSGLAGKAKAIMRSPIAFTEATMWPTMTYWVPRVKATTMADSVTRILKMNPGKTMEELRPQFRQAWNLIDMAAGQVQYGRLFLRNAAKNFAQGTIRAPGWSGGSIALFGGALKDTVKFIGEWAKTGKAPADIPDRVAFTISTIGTAMVLNGMLTYMLTGEKPHGMDWWAFRDGGKDDNGNPTRMILPTYTKDLFSWFKNPVHTLVAKMHPLLSLGLTIGRNRDYYNNMIWDEEKGVLNKDFVLKVGGEYIRAYEPFWTRGMGEVAKREGGLKETITKHPGKLIAPEFGIMPATKAYTQTKADALMDKYGSRFQFTRTPEEAEMSGKMRELYHLIKQGKTGEAKELSAQGKKEGWLTSTKEKNLNKKVVDAKVYRFKNIKNIEQAIKVYEVADDEEKIKYARILRAKWLKYIHSATWKELSLEKKKRLKEAKEDALNK